MVKKYLKIEDNEELSIFLLFFMRISYKDDQKSRSVNVSKCVPQKATILNIISFIISI